MPTSSVYDQIPVLRSSGTGSTALAAFHNALVGVDLGQYNLVRLSSAIPPHTIVDGSGKADAPSGEWGDRLSCVYAEQRTTVLGEQAWAGMGWVQRLDGRGGLFVEHEGTCEELVTNAIRDSLHDMVSGMEDEFTGPDWVLNGVQCTGDPICSLVIAPYECQPWVGANTSR